MAWQPVVPVFQRHGLVDSPPALALASTSLRIAGSHGRAVLAGMRHRSRLHSSRTTLHYLGYHKERCRRAECADSRFACAAVAADNPRWWTGRDYRFGSLKRQLSEAAAQGAALAYWLSQSSIAIDPINYDQNSIWGFAERLLEAVVRTANPRSRRSPAVLGQSRQP